MIVYTHMLLCKKCTTTLRRGIRNIAREKETDLAKASDLLPLLVQMYEEAEQKKWTDSQTERRTDRHTDTHTQRTMDK